ncbi:MAG: urease accessory protein [Alphaproteobacteria bacterium]|nr:urease accessory protein [Alphaproteobacteria bacterium]|tara:strand:- start:376 stop:1200 length:825 start_codon:yes stop_codon:yes gene_type:complete
MASGRAEIDFAYTDGRTRLSHLYQSDPLRILFPDPGAGEPETATLVTTSGGLVGGDHLSISVAAGAGATARVVGQAAEKVYRSTGADVRIDMRLSVAADGWLEWLPQETIVFDSARLRRRAELDVAPGGRLLAGEMIVFGRAAMGEVLQDGLVHEAWDVHRGGRLVWADAVHLDGDVTNTLTAAAGFDGAAAFASMVYAGDDAAALLPSARAGLDAVTADRDLRCAATCVGDVLIVRWLGRDARRLRDTYGKFWADFRHRIAELPAAMPRLWAI